MEDGCPQEISDVFIQMGMNELSSAKNLKAIGRLLSQFIRTQKKQLHHHGDIVITIDELLDWEIWPHFVRIVCKFVVLCLIK